MTARTTWLATVARAHEMDETDLDAHMAGSILPPVVLDNTISMPADIDPLSPAPLRPEPQPVHDGRKAHYVHWGWIPGDRLYPWRGVAASRPLCDVLYDAEDDWLWMRSNATASWPDPDPRTDLDNLTVTWGF